MRTVFQDWNSLERPPCSRSHSTATGLSAALLVIWLVGVSQVGRGSSLPAGFTEETIPGPWDGPVGLTFEPDQQTTGGRAYVWERNGLVWIVEDGAKQFPPLIDISEE